MPEITTQNKELTALKGRHLWHAPLSSCSQRVRIVMAELGLGYESHLVDLEAGEHASEAYQAIHPDGVVPALVEDGLLYIESIDIIQHLSKERYGDVSLSEQAMLDAANGAQKDLKLLTFEFLFRAKPPSSSQTVEAFQRNHKNLWLRQFYLDFADGFDPQRINDSVMRIDHSFAMLNTVVSDGRKFLGGTDFGLVDIAWMPNVHRMALMGWPFEDHPALEAWFARTQERPSYKEGLMDWQGEPVAQAFSHYTRHRHAEGTDVRSYLKSVQGKAHDDEKGALNPN